MTQKEYFTLIKEEEKSVNWRNKESIRKFNEFKRNLRSLMEFEQE